MFEENSLKEFTAKLASGEPFPGGGGASALAAALAASLGGMVVEVTKNGGRSKLPADELEDLRRRTETLRKNFLRLIDRDAEVFEPLSDAYRLPKDSPNRDAALELCLREAASAPLEIFDLCCETAELLMELGEKCTGLIASDVATAAAICRGALFGAACNVRINTKLMKDREYADELDGYIAAGLTEYASVAKKIFDDIYFAL